MSQHEQTTPAANNVVTARPVWRPATPDQAMALAAFRRFPVPLKTRKISRKLGWMPSRVEYYLELFTARGLMRATRCGRVWT